MTFTHKFLLCCLNWRIIFISYQIELHAYVHCIVLQDVREALHQHVIDFGDKLRKENHVGVIIDGEVHHSF